MVSLKDVADAIKMLADVIKSTREIVKAVADGRAYLTTHFPSARGELAELLTLMRQTVAGLAEVTAVPGNFRFTFDASVPDPAIAARELREFNNYVIAQQGKVQALRNRISELKSSCDRVADLRHNLNILAGQRGAASLFGLLGVAARERAVELGNALGDLYGNDQWIIERINTMLNLTAAAMKDVDETLGPPGRADAGAMPAAAAQLGVYATLFKDPTHELHALVDELDAAKATLAGP